MALWTALDAAAATSGIAIGDWTVDGVSIDTRTIKEGDLFVALTAARDGHDFVADALSKGASAAMVSRIPDGVPSDAPLLLVDDVLSGLIALGHAGRTRTDATVIAVTGSVGKTSTKDMLRHVLKAQGNTHAAEASYNNHWGVPLTLARMPVETRFAIVEIGMNHPGEIAPLSQLTRPHIAIVTTVAAAHLEAFEDLSGIAREKASIFDGLEPGGTAIFNADLPTSEILREAATGPDRFAVPFGTDPHANVVAQTISLSENASVVEGRFNGDPFLFKVGAPGKHFALNALAVLAAAAMADADLDVAACDIGTWRPPSGRGQRETLVLDPVEGLTFELIDDAFNANPASMSAALDVLAGIPTQDNVGRVGRGRRIAILGDMLELGPTELALHAEIADHPAMNAISRVYCVGPRMRALFDRLPVDQRGEWYESAEELAAEASRLIDAGDVVFVKGSKGIHVSEVVRALRKLGQAKEHEEGLV